LILLLAIAFSGCDYARMYDQDAIKTYKGKMPAMDKRTMPVNNGFQVLLHADPQGLKNPLAYSKESVERGRLAYGYFCVQCHGLRLDGRGTVGQSFVPLPANLTSDTVLSKGDGPLYSEVRLGVARHPRLFSTVSSEDAWAMIIYMRSKKGSP
jgi:mono/diheme cytochrome c family protein